MTSNAESNPPATEQRERERKKPGRVPCETCLKRGCGAICPNGSLTTGKGNRLVLADTEELHNRIEVMSARIRDLEDALKQAHSNTFDRPHPLLAGSITVIPQGNVPETSPDTSQSRGSNAAATKTEPDSVIDAFGTLTIGTRGETTFVGSTARSEPPIKQAQTRLPLMDYPRLSTRVMSAWIAENDLAPADEELQKHVMEHLPSLSEAVRLCEIYLDWGKTLWNPLSRHELFDCVLESVYRADTVFWQLFLMDTWLSFYAGRPPSVSPDWIDAPYPDDEFATRNDKDELEMSWHSWSWRYSRLLHDVMVNGFGTKTPTYKTILELDRKIRDFPVPACLQPRCEEGAPNQSPISVLVQRLYALTSKEATLLNIHRRYFSQALQDAPNDFLKHKYGPSVMAMYRSAWRLIISHSQMVTIAPHVLARIPIFWSHAFSAAIVMCMIVTRAPTSNLAVSSLQELDLVYDVFLKAAPTTKIAMVLLDSITKIWRKGHGTVDHPNSDGLSGAELDRLGGGSTRLISKNSPSPPGSHAGSSPSSEGDSASSGQSGRNLSSGGSSNFFELYSNIHPRIMQDMRTFDGFEPSFTAPGGPHQTPLGSLLTDAQFSQNVFSTEVYTAQQQVLNTFDPAQPQPLQFHSQGAYQPEGPVLDSAWQSFVEQLGF
ncbi:hypothetical protein BU15DRAFT_88887 [Melanogaster broomeanus]|nr:hypothetical protein BU15DRAFT_88887 [Melanogaster broomeanus]